MGVLREIQDEHRAWLERNFPHQTLEQIALGCAEEAGELAHHVLKREQGIRTDEDHVGGALDAGADFVIFFLGICDHYGCDFEELMHSTWTSVSKRNWVDHPEKGVPA